MRNVSLSSLSTFDLTPCAKICVDMWHSLYALNYAMTTNAAGVPSGPVAADTGPAGRTVPSISEWLPPILKTQS